MLFKNILKLSSIVFLASESLAKPSYSGNCGKVNDLLVSNTKSHLREFEEIEEFQPLKECKEDENGSITDMYLVSQRIDENAIKEALSDQSIKRLTYFLDNEFYQREPAVYNGFPSDIAKLENLEELTLKYNEKGFVHGHYPYYEAAVSEDIFELSSKKIKTITLDHIKLTFEILQKISQLESLEKLNIITGEDTHQSTYNEDYDLLRNFKKYIPNIVLDGVSINTNAHEEKECNKVWESLIDDVNHNLKGEEDPFNYQPLRECKVNSKGEIDEMYLVSERNNKEAIEEALNRNSLTKLTYVLDNDYYKKEPAVYNDFPEAINKLTNLKELTLKYIDSYFDHNNSYFLDREINPNVLKLNSVESLTLDHIKITDELLSQIGQLKTLKKLNIVLSGKLDYEEKEDTIDKLLELSRNGNLKLTINNHKYYSDDDNDSITSTTTEAATPTSIPN